MFVVAERAAVVFGALRRRANGKLCCASACKVDRTVDFGVRPCVRLCLTALFCLVVLTLRAPSLNFWDERSQNDVVFSVALRRLRATRVVVVTRDKSNPALCHCSVVNV